MKKYIVEVLKTDFITHNVKRFVTERPAGYSFVSGQATDVAINKPGLENELRPFTFTCINDWDQLEFIIKIYTGHDGITEKLLDVSVGDQLIVHDVFGTISYKGPGVFIAGGAGITPFISIFRDLKQRNELPGNKLLFADRKAEDIILKDELSAMLGRDHLDILQTPPSPDIPGGFIDETLLKQHLGDEKTFFYICGPDKFTSVMIETLLGLGVKNSQLVFEQ